MMRSLEAERSVRIPQLLLLLHDWSAPEPYVVPHGIGTPLHRRVYEPLIRTVAELFVVAEWIVESGPASSSPSGSGGTELGRGGEPAALIESAAAAPRKPLRRPSLW